MYEKFLKLLKEHGITAYKVSKDTSISQATLSDWKKGKSTPKLDKLAVLADYFGVGLNYFTGEKNDLAENEIPEEFVIMARKTEKLSEQQRQKIYSMLNQTIDDVIALIDEENKSESD